MSSERQLHDHKQGHITPAECTSMRLLAKDGWSPGELKMTFQVTSYATVTRHVQGQCSHDNHEVNL